MLRIYDDHFRNTLKRLRIYRTATATATAIATAHCGKYRGPKRSKRYVTAGSTWKTFYHSCCAGKPSRSHPKLGQLDPSPAQAQARPTSYVHTTSCSKRKNQGKNQKEPKYFCWICWDWGQVRFSEPSYTSNAQVWIHGLDQSFDFAVCSRRHICQVQIQKGIHLAIEGATNAKLDNLHQDSEDMKPHVEIKMLKTWLGLTTFGRSHAEKLDALVVPTTCPSQNIKNWDSRTTFRGLDGEKIIVGEW